MKKSTETNYSVKVLRAHEFENGNVSFDMLVNGVTIYGCTYIETKKGSFVSFPQRKDKDGKYWNNAYFKVEEDVQADIEKQLEALI